MIYAHFINRIKAHLDLVEQGLRSSQVVDYHRDHVALDDTVFDGFLQIIEQANVEAEDQENDLSEHTPQGI